MWNEKFAMHISAQGRRKVWAAAATIAGAGASILLAAATTRWGWLPLIIAAAACAMVFSMRHPFLIAIGLVLAVALSPELPLGLPLRLEDFILPWGVILFGLRLATHRTSWPRVTNWRPWLALLIGESVATLIGAIQGTTQLNFTVYSGLIFLVKDVETFLLYLIIIWLLDHPAKVRAYTWVLLIGGMLLGLYGMVTHLTGNVPMQVAGPGAYTPVVDIEGGPTYSTIAGSLVPSFVLAFTLGFMNVYPWGALIWLIIPIGYSITFSLSRQWYVGLVTAVSVVIWMRSKRLFILAVPLLLVVLWLFPNIIPVVVSERVAPMFDPLTGGEEGMQAYRTRINAWLKRFPEMWETNPITGRGLASLPPGFLDNQYLAALYYSGFIGLGAFAWLLAAFAQQAGQLYRSSSPPWARAMGLAGLAVIAGFAVTGLGGLPFVAVRVRGMFWLLMAGIAACANLTDVNER